MERQFQINWPSLACEAKQRRKRQKLTQARLSTLAGVSTPTISRFENGEQDIQLSSIMKILGVLGMVDGRNLVFPDTQARYDYSRMIVVFTGQDGDKAVTCGITREALEDHFGDGEPLKVFAANREAIEHEARRKYLAGMVDADGVVLVKTGDV